MMASAKKIFESLKDEFKTTNEIKDEIGAEYKRTRNKLKYLESQNFLTSRKRETEDEASLPTLGREKKKKSGRPPEEFKINPRGEKKLKLLKSINGKISPEYEAVLLSPDIETPEDLKKLRTKSDLVKKHTKELKEIVETWKKHFPEPELIDELRAKYGWREIYNILTEKHEECVFNLLKEKIKELGELYGKNPPDAVLSSRLRLEFEKSELFSDLENHIDSDLFANWKELKEEMVVPEKHRQNLLTLYQKIAKKLRHYSKVHRYPGICDILREEFQYEEL